MVSPAQHALALYERKQPLERLFDALATGTAQDWLECAQALVLQRDCPAALAIIDAALARHPAEADLLHARAGLLLQTGSADAAEAQLRELLETCPSHGAASFLLAGLLRDQGRARAMAETLLHYVLRVDADPDAAIPAMESLEQAGRLEDALAIGEAALHRHPADTRLCVLVGTLLAQLGRFDEARHHHGLVLEKSSQALEWHVPLALSELQRYTDRHHVDFATFERLLEQPGLTATARAGLQFALGKAYDDVGDYALAARHLRDANALMHAAHPWSRKTFKRSIDARMARRLPPVRRAAPATWAPLFLVGMPRSGSTLLAELLARHPDVCSRGELPWLPVLAAPLDPLAAQFPAAMDAAALRYAAQLRQDDDASSRARWFIDKQPRNYMEVDLALAMFPQARVIHCTRNARDNALSLWMQSFQPGTQDFAYDFGDIAAAIHGCRRLMRHWSKRYGDAIRTVRYEELVRAPEACLSGLLQWLGLPERDLLHTAATGAAVSTASLWQVRQPLHARSVARWRNYEALLPELLALPDDPAEPGGTS